jgi:hypothetical protein
MFWYFFVSLLYLLLLGTILLFLHSAAVLSERADMQSEEFIRRLHHELDREAA